MREAGALVDHPDAVPSQRLGRPFRLFFGVTLFFDLGFALYFFLINLYLANLHFTERSIGLVAGALTLGNVLATLPTGMIARRVGLRPLFFFCLTAAPLFAAVRTFAMHPAAQIALAFLQGMAMCSYTVCFPPALARLTTEGNRTAAFSITFGTGIASGAVAGLIGGFAPGWMRRAGWSPSVATEMRNVLLLACGCVLVGLLPLLRLRFPPTSAEGPQATRNGAPSPLLMRILGAIAIWCFATGAFAPFGSIYLSGRLHVPLEHIGLIFSASQALQVAGVAAAPLLYRWLGKERGIACAQIGAAASLMLLGSAGRTSHAIVFYLSLAMFQYMCSPGIYSLVMDRTPDGMRASASALQNIVSCLSLAGAAAIAGVVITHLGYLTLLSSAAVFAAVSAMLFFRMPHAPAATLQASNVPVQC